MIVFLHVSTRSMQCNAIQCNAMQLYFHKTIHQTTSKQTHEHQCFVFLTQITCRTILYNNNKIMPFIILSQVTHLWCDLVKLGGGDSHWEVVQGCAALKTPFFWLHFSFRDPPCLALFQLQRPHFYFFFFFFKKIFD